LDGPLALYFCPEEVVGAPTGTQAVPTRDQDWRVVRRSPRRPEAPAPAGGCEVAVWLGTDRRSRCFGRSGFLKTGGWPHQALMVQGGISGLIRGETRKGETWASWGKSGRRAILRTQARGTGQVVTAFVSGHGHLDAAEVPAPGDPVSGARTPPGRKCWGSLLPRHGVHRVRMSIKGGPKGRTEGPRFDAT